MGDKDTKAKEFLTDNERFADLFNYYLFNGQQVISPAELEERDTTSVLTLYGAGGKEAYKQRWRDLLKSAIIKSTQDSIFVLLGVENQSDVHYAMPVKAMVYDSMNYSVQVNEITRMHRNAKDYNSNAEFLSGFKKEDKLIPIITLTVYWGADEWDGPRSLHEMFSDKYESLFPYIDDHHLHLIIPREIEDFHHFKTELGAVLEFIKASANEEEMDRVVRENPKFRSMGNDAVSAINVFTGIQIPINRERGVVDMCKAWEDHRKSGLIEGEAKAIVETGYEFGLSEGDILDRLQKKLNIPLQKAQEYLRVFGEHIIS